MSAAGPNAPAAPLPTDPEVLKACTFDGARETLKNKDLVSARHLTGWPVMGGAIVTMDGPAHRARRKLESALFGPKNLPRYELEVLQPAIDTALRQAAEQYREEDGVVRLDLVALGRRMMISISAAIVGLDIANDDEARFRRLDDCLTALIGGVTIEWSHDDHTEVLARAVEWKRVFGDEFVTPAMERRREVIARTGSWADEQPDLISTLLSDPEQEWSYDDVLTECVQYLVASSGTSVTSTVHTINHLIEWFEEHPEDRARVGDADFLRQAAMESLRLHPGPHILMRRAVADVETAEFTAREGDFVGADVRQANRDPEVFGEHPERFDLQREVRKDAQRDGFTFGGGRHVCIGRPLALGTYGRRGEEAVDGTIVRALRTLFAAGVRPSQTATPRRANGVDDRFEFFPVVLADL
jgi:cytochrome P450